MAGFRDTDAWTFEILLEALVVLGEPAQLELGHGLFVRLDVHRSLRSDGRMRMRTSCERWRELERRWLIARRQSCAPCIRTEGPKSRKRPDRNHAGAPRTLFAFIRPSARAPHLHRFARSARCFFLFFCPSRKQRSDRISACTSCSDNTATPNHRARSVALTRRASQQASERATVESTHAHLKRAADFQKKGRRQLHMSLSAPSGL